jgi:hypothetical protein
LQRAWQKIVAEQFLHLKTAKNQNAVRDYALFIVLLHTGLQPTDEQKEKAIEELF